MVNLIKAALPFLGLLGAAVLVAGGVVLLARAGESPAATPEAGVTEKTAPAEETVRIIPPMDAAALAEVETATFALG